jgi:hypothetical protein
MQTYESLTCMSVTSFLGLKLLRQREWWIGSVFRIDGNAAATLSCNTLQSQPPTVIVTEPDICLLHNIPTSSTRAAAPSSSAALKSLKEEGDPPTFLVILERTSLSLAQAACPGPEILSAGQAILRFLLGGGVRRRIA